MGCTPVQAWQVLQSGHFSTSRQAGVEGSLGSPQDVTRRYHIQDLALEVSTGIAGRRRLLVGIAAVLWVRVGNIALQSRSVLHKAGLPFLRQAQSDERLCIYTARIYLVPCDLEAL